MNRRPVSMALTVAMLAATPVVATVVTATSAQAADCTYNVLDNTYVRENPSINSVVLKTKEKGSVVTGPPGCVKNTGWDGRQWYEVYCSCASDGYGWMIADKLFNPLLPGS